MPSLCFCHRMFMYIIYRQGERTLIFHHFTIIQPDGNSGWIKVPVKVPFGWSDAETLGRAPPRVFNPFRPASIS